MGKADKNGENKRTRTKKAVYYIAEDTSSFRAHYGKILADDAKRLKYSDPLEVLAEDFGISIGHGQDLRTTAPLKNLIEGKKVSAKSKQIFEEKIGLRFRPVRVPLKGRPKQPCAFEDMRATGARIGIVPNHMHFSTLRAKVIWLTQQLEKRLHAKGIEKVSVKPVSNRHAAIVLEDGFHFVIGAAETIDNQPYIEGVHTIHDQRIGILAPETIEQEGQIVVTVGTAEEAILRSLAIDHNKIVAVDFGNPEEAHAKLFDMVKRGTFIGAVSSILAVHNYLAAHSNTAHRFFEIFNQARLSGPVGETKSISLEPDPVYADSGVRLISVQSDHVDAWLRKHCDYQGEDSVLEFSFPLCIAIPKRSSRYNYTKLKKFLRQPIPPAFPKPKNDAEELQQLFDLAIKRFANEQSHRDESGGEG